MTAGQSLTIETVRVAAAFYVLSLAAWLERRDRASRINWTVAYSFYIVHVAAAFQFYHHWSHSAAYLETARQTALVTGLDWGGGVYFNYLFTLIWTADVLWWWRVGLAAYRKRGWTGSAIHGFLAFMFFNATVVFASGAIRWLGIAATFALLVLAWRRRRAQSSALG